MDLITHLLAPQPRVRLARLLRPPMAGSYFSVVTDSIDSGENQCEKGCSRACHFVLNPLVTDPFGISLKSPSALLWDGVCKLVVGAAGVLCR